MEIRIPNPTKRGTQKKIPAKIDNKLFAVEVVIPILANASGFATKKLIQNQNPIAKITKKIQHPIPNFFKEKLALSPVLIVVGLFTFCCCPYHKAFN
ncbi:hypothetical protein IJM86_08935 [bacterium]|nr:hypothetical protein [bacterium]